MTAAIYHPFQEAGLGEAPFRLVDVIETKDAAQIGIPLGCCHFCGAGLRFNFILRDRSGRLSVVGCDCVMKTGDAELMTAAELERKRHEKALREAARAAKWEADQAARMAKLDEQRARNGGLTDYEMVEQRLREEARRRTEGNGWLVEVLEQVDTSGDFLPSIIRDLTTHTAAVDLSERAKSILADIYARQVSGKRRGPEFDAAADEFWGKAERS